MSAPRRAARDAGDLGYSFLAVRAARTLPVVGQRQLAADERAVLTKAADFLSDISNGALITGGGVLEGVRPSRSIAALNVAFGPLEQLRRITQDDKEIATVFGRLSQAVRAAANAQLAEAQDIETAQSFFSGLSDWLSTELSARKRSRPRETLHPLLQR
jgi:hypothetical protein